MMPKLKGSTVHYSRFNHIVDLGGGRWGLYNFRTGRLATLNALTKDSFDHALDRSANTAAVRKLREEGFLVDYDELSHLKTVVTSRASQTTALGLVICPTLACNFACPYCFEHARSGMMSPEMQDKVVEFTRKKLDEHQFARFEVVWYGGEPLLGLDVIERLSERLIALCDERGTSYHADIVTNGYFLDQHAADVLERARVSSAQVTLDGPTAQVHDATRHLRGGGGTFDRIVGNLRSIRTGVELNIRCNCHAGNLDHVQALKGLVDELGRETPNSFRFVPSRMDGDICAVDPESSRQIGLERKDFASWLEHYDWGDKLLPRYRFFGSSCMASNAHGYAIDDLGDIYICWEHVGDQSLVVGNIDDYINDREPDARIAVYDRYMQAVWPGDDPECMECELLPCCMGGCVYKRVALHKHGCTPLKQNVDSYVAQLCRQNARCKAVREDDEGSSGQGERGERGEQV